MNKLIRLYRGLYFKIQSALHPLKKQVLFLSFNGRQYSDNPRAICEKMHKTYPEYTLVWYLANSANAEEKNQIIPDYVKVVSGRWRNFLRELAVSRVFVTNTEMGEGIFKRKGQFFVQTWHGDIGLKKVLYDVSCRKNGKATIQDDQITDLCVAGSDYGIHQYRSSFRYNGEILTVGTPRNDKLVRPQEKERKEIRARLGVDSKSKVLVFAPTFRDCLTSKQNLLVDLEKTVEILEEKGDKWICLIRVHVNSVGLNFVCDGKRFIDVSKYPDMADILSIGDLLITDYSSCAGDFIRMNKGVILAIFDKDEYSATCRELSYDINEVGFLTAENQVELETLLRNTSQSDYEKNCAKICASFRAVECGNAAGEVCAKIASWMNRFVE